MSDISKEQQIENSSKRATGILRFGLIFAFLVTKLSLILTLNDYNDA